MPAILVRGCWILPALFNPGVLTVLIVPYLESLTFLRLVNLHCVLSTKRLHFADMRTSVSLIIIFLFSGCWLPSAADLNVTHSQVPHMRSSGPLNTLLPPGMLCTFRAGLELAFLHEVTPPVWLQCLRNPEFWFPQCLWLSSVAALKQNYLSNNLKCFASTNELSLPMSWDANCYW